MTCAWPIVARNCPSAAVFVTACRSASLICVASPPIERANSRIGTTSATTTSTMTMPMAKPTYQPFITCSFSDRFAEVPDRFEVRVHRRQHRGHRPGLVRDHVDAPDHVAQRVAHVFEVEDDPQQGHRRDPDDQCGND